MFGWVNRRFLRLPQAVGLLLIGLFLAVLLSAAETLPADPHYVSDISNALKSISFTDVVMNGMLAFLLFAGALNVNLAALRDRAYHIAILALFGTLVSTVLVGIAFWLISSVLGFPLTMSWALVFGSLISPTDPVAVLASLKQVGLPSHIEAEMQGEALFNDGVGVVIFTVLLGFAATSGHPTTALKVGADFVREAGGGIALGAATGLIAYFALRAIDDFSTEVLITLALVAATYSIAQRLGTSGPLAVVAAGLLVGSRGRRYAMSDVTERYVNAVWTLIDEILNAVLFVLIGLEVVAFPHRDFSLALALAAVPITLLARFVSVGLPVLLVPNLLSVAARNVPFLTWAGVRGGISLALALSIPDDPVKSTILAATYAVVIFSVVVQGTTLGKLARVTWGTKGIMETES